MVSQVAWSWSTAILLPLRSAGELGLLQAALKRLQMDYVDLIFCHRPDTTTPIEETVRAMNFVIDQVGACCATRRPLKACNLLIELCDTCRVAFCDTGVVPACVHAGTLNRLMAPQCASACVLSATVCMCADWRAARAGLGVLLGCARMLAAPAPYHPCSEKA